MAITDFGMTVGILLVGICIFSILFALFSYRTYKRKPDNIKIAIFFIFIGSLMVFSGGALAFLIRLFFNARFPLLLHASIYGIGTVLMLSALSYVGLYIPKFTYRKPIWIISTLLMLVFLGTILSLDEKFVTFSVIRGYDDLQILGFSTILLGLLMLVIIGEHIILLIMVGMKSKNRLVKFRVFTVAFGTFIAATGIGIMIVGPAITLMIIAYIIYLFGLYLFFIGYNIPKFISSRLALVDLE
ncbi:MAG: hypothetical protein INQ03_16905 [Candidatus Heimdallarchaeota archaeon]|nr:hypothetical protein [Candidatus Heimdallarchaeota archaeon]